MPQFLKTSFKALMVATVIGLPGAALAKQVCNGSSVNAGALGHGWIAGVVGSSTMLNHANANNNSNEEKNEFLVSFENNSNLIHSDADYTLLPGDDGTQIKVEFDFADDGASLHTFAKPNNSDGLKLTWAGATIGRGSGGLELVPPDAFEDLIHIDPVDSSAPFFTLKPKEEILFRAGAKLGFNLTMPQSDAPNDFAKVYVKVSGTVQVCGKRVKLPGEIGRAFSLHMQPLVMRGANVGIGTNKPQARLDVNGSVRIREEMAVDGEATFSAPLHLKKGVNFESKIPFINFNIEESERNWVMIGTEEFFGIKSQLFLGHGIFLEPERTRVLGDLYVEGSFNADQILVDDVAMVEILRRISQANNRLESEVAALERIVVEQREEIDELIAFDQRVLAELRANAAARVLRELPLSLP